MGSSVNILYERTFDRMENTPELARKMILPQTSHFSMDLTSEVRSPGTVTFLVRIDPYNVVTEFRVLDVESSYNAILGRLWIHMTRVILSTHHQLLKYPTPSGMVNIKGDQAMARTIVTIAWKKSDWITKTSRAVFDKDSPVDKKRTADQ